MTIRVCIAGVTGQVGRELAAAVAASVDLELVGGVARSSAGIRLRDALPAIDADFLIARTLAEALEVPTDVVVDFTDPRVVKTHVLEAITHRVHVVIGTSGLSEPDFADFDRAARDHGVGVMAAGNFSLPAALMLRFAEAAARHLPSWEVIDYAGAEKVDAPSGTARELANRLGGAGRPDIDVPVDDTVGERSSRGALLDGTPVHSVRLPGHTIGAEVLFGKAGERLSIRYDGGPGAEPYIAGALLAVRRVPAWVGLRRGLDRLLP